MPNAEFKKLSKNDFITALIAIIILLIFTILAIHNPRLSPLEISFGRWVYSWPNFLRVPMLAATQLGNVLFAFVLLTVLVLGRRYRLALKVGLAGGGAFVVSTIFKLAVHRPRPTILQTGGMLREAATFGYGFPSGHTALAVAVGLIILPRVPHKYRWVVLLLMLLVATSRIYLGAHSLFDVIGGACIGVLVAIAVSYFVPRLAKIRGS